MVLSTDLRISEQFRPASSVPGVAFALPGGSSFPQVLSAAYQARNSSSTGSLSAQSGGTDYEYYFQAAANAYQIPEDLLKAVAKAESDFNPNAVSSCGAQGMMQLMPSTARSLGVTDSFDPAQNIMGGAKYLRQMLDRFGGDVANALAAYNAGPGAVTKYGGIPPYQETQNYVAKVLRYADSGFSVSPLTSYQPSAAPAASFLSASTSSSLTQSDLTDLICQMYRSSGISNQETAYMLLQKLLQQSEEESEDPFEMIHL